MKKTFTSHYLKLCAAMIILVNPITGKQITKPTNIPTKIQPIQPVPVPTKQVPGPKISTDHTKNDPEVLDINRSVKVINNQHDCSANNWNNNSDDACQCCLTYGKGRFGEEQTADQIINHCTNISKQCSPSSIANIKRKYNEQNMSSEDFLNTLYSNSTVVHKMSFNPALLGQHGKLTENSLSAILEQAYNEGKLKHKEFNGKQCLNVKTLDAGGINTAQLFLVSSTCIPSNNLLYIVKESKKGLSEATNLQKIAEYPGMKELIAPNIKEGFPTVSLPFFYFSYHPHHQNIHYMATMPAATGAPLCELTTDFRDNQSPENAERLKRAYRILGEELGNFHKKFMTSIPGKIIGKTVIHGDFHCNNIFYDETKGHFTFIDNESMVNSFKTPHSPYSDFMRLIFPPFGTNETIFKGLITGIKPGTYLNLTLKPFIRGYISVYNARDQKQVLQELKALFTGKISVNFVTFNGKFMHELINKDIIPIFDDIAKSLQK